MNTLPTFFEEKILPSINKFSSSRFISTLRDGMVLSMPLLIVGSILLVFAELPIAAYQNFMAQTFGEGWKWFSGAAVSATMGLVAIFANIGIASSLARSRQKDPFSAIALSLSAYFILLVQLDDGGFNLNDFGAKGLFSAIIVAFITAEIYCYILEKNWIITMPEGVPPAIAKSFAALIPSAIIIPLFLIIRFIFSITPYESVNTFILTVLQAPLTGITATYGGIMFTVFCSHLLWFLGIHGGAIVGAVAGPMFTAASLENLAAFQAGKPLPFIVTGQFNELFQGYGGVGSTLALSALMAFYCKSQQLKTLGRLTLVPGIFGINEPVIYGLPMVMNPLLAIPFFLAPLTCVTIAYFSMKFGFLNLTTGISIPWTTPPMLNGFLATGDVRAILVQGAGIILSGLIYFPFLKIMDKKYYQAELEATALAVKEEK